MYVWPASPMCDRECVDSDSVKVSPSLLAVIKTSAPIEQDMVTTITPMQKLVFGESHAFDFGRQPEPRNTPVRSAFPGGCPP
jgi:hypothetical protein